MSTATLHPHKPETLTVRVRSPNGCTTVFHRFTVLRMYRFSRKAMPEVPVPFTGEEVDTSDGTGAVITVVLLILGFGVFSMAQGIGGALASTANDKIAQYTGINPTSGNSAQVEAV